MRLALENPLSSHASPLVLFLRNLYLDHRTTPTPSRACSALPCEPARPFPQKPVPRSSRHLLLPPPVSFSLGNAADTFFCSRLRVFYCIGSQGGSRTMGKGARASISTAALFKGQRRAEAGWGQERAGGLAGGRTFRPDPATTEDQAARKERR